jgi:AP-2 complex subunit alpha
VEIQQRATEYLRLSEVCNATVLATILEIMPPYPEKQSPLLVRLKQKKPLTEAEGSTEPSTTPTVQTEETPKLAVHLHQQQEQPNGLLVSLDTIESNGYYDQSTSFSLPTTTTSSSTKKFLFKNSDIIFENDLLQIGIKGQLMKSILHVEFYYGNKTNFNLSNISTNITLTGELESGK